MWAVSLENALNIKYWEDFSFLRVYFKWFVFISYHLLQIDDTLPPQVVKEEKFQKVSGHFSRLNITVFTLHFKTLLFSAAKKFTPISFPTSTSNSKRIYRENYSWKFLKIWWLSIVIIMRRPLLFEQLISYRSLFLKNL